MKKIIITVIGKDAVGIIASVCCCLADRKVNILDINQTIVKGYFNMMMIADMEMSEVSLSVLSDELEAVGAKIGVTIHCQSEALFDSMHRI